MLLADDPQYGTDIPREVKRRFLPEGKASTPQS